MICVNPLAIERCELWCENIELAFFKQVFIDEVIIRSKIRVNAIGEGEFKIGSGNGLVTQLYHTK